MLHGTLIKSLVLQVALLFAKIGLKSCDIESSCLNIICKAATNCDTDRRCLGSGNAHCGPFDISFSYWKESGSPGLSFQSCAFNFNCSKSSVASYLNKHVTDCDENGIIDCRDYSAVHSAGRDHCKDTWVPRSSFMQSVYLLSGYAAEASESRETRISMSDAPTADLREYGRVSARRRPTAGPARRYSVMYVPGDTVHDILSALDPWILDAGSRRTNRRPVNNRPNAGPRRRRVRPQARPVAPVAPTASTEPPIRSTSPFIINATRRRTRTTIAPSTTAYVRPTTPVTSATIPWWRLATSTLHPVMSATAYPTVARRVTTTTTMATTTTRITTAVPRVTTSTVASVSRRNTYRVPEITLPPTTPPTIASARPTTTTAISSTTPKPIIKPTFNPNRMNPSPPSVNDVDHQPHDVAVKPNASLPVTPLSDACMECMCMGSSGCSFDSGVKCHGEEECGAYRIDYAYWYEAGFPGYKGKDDDFIRCASDRTCAEKAVRAYVTSHAKDCNSDGLIDCLDYASIHKAGPDSCNTDWMYDSKFWSAFSACYGFDEKDMNRRRRR